MCLYLLYCRETKIVRRTLVMYDLLDAIQSAFCHQQTPRNLTLAADLPNVSGAQYRYQATWQA